MKNKASDDQLLAGAIHQLQSGPSMTVGKFLMSEKTAKAQGENLKSGYQEAKDFIERLPMSWRPALLIHMADCAYKQSVFQPGGASRLVAAWEQRQDIVEP